jgi:hypothetical protein
MKAVYNFQELMQTAAPSLYVNVDVAWKHKVAPIFGLERER